VEWPSGGMQSNARSMAKVNAIIANGGSLGTLKLLSPHTCTLLMSNPIIEYDGFLKCHTSFSQGGVAKMADIRGSLVRSDFSEMYKGFWGWCGLGGSLSLWDVDRKVGLAYAMNGKTLQGISGPRGDRIMTAVQSVLKRIL
jgi:hypothetical protein